MSSETPPDPEPLPGFPVDSSERLYDSHWCGLRRDQLVLPDGKLQEYHVFEVPDAVSIVPVLPDGRLLLLWQYRYPHGKSHWEVPAGRIHEDEELEAAAARELREETGHRAGRLERVAGFYPTNGISAHYAHIVIAHDCVEEGAVQLDAAERLEVHVFDRARVKKLLASGAVEDGFTALALFYYLNGSSD